MSATSQQRAFSVGKRTYDCGYAPGADDRIARQARFAKRLQRARDRRAERPVVSRGNGTRSIHRDGSFEPLLPPEFLRESMAKLELHVGAGNQLQARKTLDEIFRQWDILKVQKKTGVAAANEKLAWHASNVFDARTANVIENVCSGTIGALLDCFPGAFIIHNGAGPHLVRKIAETLFRLGVIDAAETQRRIDQYLTAMESR